MNAQRLWPALLALIATAAVAAPLVRPTVLPPAQGEVIVKFKAEAASTRQYALAARADAATVRDALAGRAAALGARVGRALQAGAAIGPRMQVVRDTTISAEALAARLTLDPEVEYAEPNGRQRRMAAPNDPYYLAGPAVNNISGSGGPVSGQWYLRAPTSSVVSAIDIEAAWARTLGYAGVVVAVLDTGVRREHPDLAGRLLAGYDFVTDTDVANDGDGRDANPDDPGDWTTSAENNNESGKFYKCGSYDSVNRRYLAEDSSWHGTKTASLVGAATNDGVGMAGAAPGVKILPVRVLGKCYGDRADILPAIRWAAGLHVDGVPDNPNPAKVINLSLGGGTCSAAYQDVINEVRAAGVTVVASAGNSAGQAAEAPASCSGVVGVTALRHVGTKVGFSSLGANVVISAPGGNCVNTIGACLYPILAASNTGLNTPGASTWSDSFDYTVGTSFSSPLVAGVVGLMYSAQPALAPAEALSLLQLSARPFVSTGGTAGIGQCRAPNTSVQDECYCTTSTCGAGMLDAGAAVGMVLTLARSRTTTATPTANSPVTFSALESVLATGASVQSYQWAIADGGGVVSAFTTSTNSSTATVLPTAAGSFTVRLTVTDSLGNRGVATQTVTVAAAPVAGAGGTSSGGGGGGAMSPLWLLLLALAVAALRVSLRRA